MRTHVSRLIAFGLICAALCSALSFVMAGKASAQSSTAPAGSVQSAETGWGQMTPERREQAISYSNTKNILYFVDFFFGVAVWLAILYSGLSAKLLAWAERVGRKRFFTLLLYLVLLLLIVTIVTLPLDYYESYHLEHQYSLSNQTVGAWVIEGLKSLAVGVVILTLLGVIGYAIIRRNPRYWWAWFGVAAVPILVFFVIIAPVVIMPIFYETKPMEDTPLRAQILNLAAQSGIADSRVFVMNASKDTNKLNAYVTGLGKTKRIVLYDNLVQSMAASEVLFVVGHEMGHYLLNHVWMGLGVAVALVFIIGFIAHKVMERMIARYRARFGFDRLASFASAPLIALNFSVIGFLLSPVQCGISRHFEHQADIFGLEKTGSGETAAHAFEKLADVNLTDPHPSALMRFWLYDHPTLSERVAFARSYGDGGGGGEAATEGAAAPADTGLVHPSEKHLRNAKQLTFGGENAEAYFSADGKKLTMQTTRGEFPCDRIFTMNIDGTDVRQISNGHGVTTCSFWAPDGQRLIYCSTHLVDDTCPPKPDYSRGYVWALHKGYDVFSCKPDGSDLKRLTDSPGYDAEAVYSPDGSKILFTSARDGDLELYMMNPDGSDQVRLTHELGYDGGAFFSPDGKMICYRANHPTDSADVADYKNLLAEGLIRPTTLELWVMNADGSGKRQVTHNGAANFCPFFHPDGKRLIFASNMTDPKKRNFELFMINLDGTGQEQITFEPTFDGFPMFNKDGTKLVWASNRHDAKLGETNIFIADWVN
jgi:Tol biopolymer transport system component/Zn-dependent protease with chaperone function